MSVEANSLHTIGVVGSGAMGSGIAQTALAVGLNVVLYDVDQAALSGAREQVLARLARLAEKGQLPTDAVEEGARRLILAAELSAMAPAQVVIEAIVEKLEPKQALFAALEKIVDANAVLATNTSSLSVAAIALRCEHRARVCGMHFFNPVPLMKLVEVIGAPDTAPAALETALALSQRLQKTAVRVKDVPGFLVNLLGRAYVTEALHVLHEGVASPATVDRIMREAAGFRMGPFELMDLTGIDVNFPATSYIYQGFQHDPRLKTTIMHEALLNAGRFGRKSGQGFHTYSSTPSTAAPLANEIVPRIATVCACDEHPGYANLQAEGVRFTDRDAADALLIAPGGEDTSSVCARMQLDPQRVVAVDFTGLERRFLTLMTAPGAGELAQRLAGLLSVLKYSVAVTKDSPGFVAPRILAMIANLGCEVAQIGVVDAPEDIDLAMRLAQNYPRGPLEWAEWLGPANVLHTLQHIQRITGSDRYRPSSWLRRRALLGLPIRTRD
jgi:3-hydroxybutyryl-CoA dehydrogenase